ncbi:MAG: HU family DNA-binding protein [Clostridiales bacterium]|jgi:DNA-binding protein HU-beta|nr:HU family DNA-binding protein [Clostridiales bacterium]
MNKSQFIKAVAAKTEMTAKDVAKIVDAIPEVVEETIKDGDKIQVTGFGVYALKTKSAREGINPRTKEKTLIKASKVPVFRFAKAYKDNFQM